jgi:hypothetical protein
MHAGSNLIHQAAEPRKKTIKVRVRIDPAGFVSLPQGFKVKRTLNTIDAWGGYIESADEKFRINFGAGMVG